MIDITPLDVRKKRGDFSKGMRGYDPGEVDSFLELVAERLEVLVKENLTLKERSERLGEQVRSQVGRERAVQEALVTAQELREDILGQARREADLVTRETEGKIAELHRAAAEESERIKRAAQAEAEELLEEARDRLDDLRDSLQELERRRVRFLKSFRALLERELGDVEVEEMRAPMEEEALVIDLHGTRRGKGRSASSRHPGPTGTEPSSVPGSQTSGSKEASGRAGAAQTHSTSTPPPDSPQAPGTPPEAGKSAIIDVADVAPSASSDSAGQPTRSTDDAGGTWTSSAVYDDKEAGSEDDATVRGA